MSSPPTILLIVPDSADRSRIADMLERHGYAVLQADSGTAARGALNGGVPKLVIVLDLAAPDALRYLRGPAATRGGAPVVCVADRRRPVASSEALRLGVADLVGRPLHESDLLAAIANAETFARTAWPAIDPEQDTVTTGAGVFGASPAIREVLAMIRRVGPSRCPVLLTGERGTGRAMSARLIHAQGPNRDAPFVKIVCGGASDTGMARVSGGDVQPGATVFLENVQELSPEEQRHLALQVGLERAGSLEAAQAETGPRNIRFIGAAPPNVHDLAERGQIRSDLVDALGVVRIDLPPLRQRVEDVPLLAMHFLKAACRMNDIPSKSFSPSALMMLGAMPWPGNAAELRSLMERLAVLVPRGTVLLEDVLAHVRFDGARALGGSRSTLREAREGFERDYIVAVLQHHHGRMGAAATELGIERTNLYRKIKQLNITWAAGAD